VKIDMHSAGNAKTQKLTALVFETSTNKKVGNPSCQCVTRGRTECERFIITTSSTRHCDPVKYLRAVQVCEAASEKGLP